MSRFKIVFSSLLALAVISLFTACQNDGVGSSSADGLVVIPQDASVVMRFDIPSMMEKMDFESVKNTPEYKEAVKEAANGQAVVEKVMMDPAASGVDLEQAAYFTVTSNPEKMNEEFIGMVFSLANNDKFASLAADFGSKTAASGYDYITPDRKAIIAWNDQFAVIGGSEGYIDLAERAGAFLNQQKSTSVAEVPDLKKAMKGDHDITTWFSSNTIAESPQIAMAMGMAEIDPEALKENYVHGYVDFLPGKVEGRANLFAQKELTKDLDKLFRDKPAIDITDYLPGENLNLLLANSLSPMGIYEVLAARPQSQGLADYSLKQYGLTVADVAAAWKGDIVLAEYQKTETDKAAIFATGIADMEKFKQVLKIGEDGGILTPIRANTWSILNSNQMPMSNAYEINFENGQPHAIIVDDILFISGDKDLLDQIQSGELAKKDRINGAITDVMYDNVFSMYSAGTLGELEDAMGEFSRLDIEDFTFKTNRKEMSLDLALKDKQTNALKQMAQVKR
ncbi:MAG: DUF4836 family protein [Bacteroidota bacterium]